MAAQHATTRKAADELFTFLPSDCAAWLRDISGVHSDPVAMIRSELQAVEPLRRWAQVLPLPWRLRVDGLAFCIGHSFCGALASEQLRRDLVDLLNGQEQPREMHEGLVSVFPMLLASLLLVDRYERDPVTRGLGREFMTVDLTLQLANSGTVIPVHHRGAPDCRLLLGEVLGDRQRYAQPVVRRRLALRATAWPGARVRVRSRHRQVASSNSH